MSPQRIGQELRLLAWQIAQAEKMLAKIKEEALRIAALSEAAHNRELPGRLKRQL